MRRGAKKLTVSLSLNRYSGSSEGFLLDIADKASGLYIMSVDIPLSSAADLFSGRTFEAPAQLSEDERFGMIHEARMVRIRIPDQNGMLKGQLEAIYDAAEKENPGWKARREDLNHHRMVKVSSRPQGPRDVHAYEVTLDRYVRKEEQ